MSLLTKENLFDVLFTELEQTKISISHKDSSENEQALL